MEFCLWFPLVHGVAVPSEMTNDNNVGQLAMPACLVPTFSFSLSLFFFATQRGEALGFCVCLSLAGGKSLSPGLVPYLAPCHIRGAMRPMGHVGIGDVD